MASKMQELILKTNEQLTNELTDLNKALFSLRISRALRNAIKTSEFKRIKKMIARIKTVLHQREGLQND